MPGSTVDAERSMISAPGGAVTAAAGPTATMRSPSTRRRASRTGAPPVPSISVPQVIRMDTARSPHVDDQVQVLVDRQPRAGPDHGRRLALLDDGRPHHAGSDAERVAAV